MRYYVRLTWPEPKAVTALRRHGCKTPWRVLWIYFKSRYLPHRGYLYSDSEGFRYKPVVLQWYIGPWMIWGNRREIARQKAGTPAQSEQNRVSPTPKNQAPL
jgi:hypothetical protein